MFSKYMVSKALIAAGIVVLILLVLVSIVWGSYNGLVSRDEGVKAAWGDVEAQYQRRIDLIPNLVSTVEGYAGFEKSLLTKVTELRTQWQTQPTPEARVQTANQFEAALRTILFTAENYPDLKASQNFIALQDELAGTENRVAVARTRYNDAVREYNVAVRGFPSNIIAGWFGFSQKTPFEATTPGAENAPKVDINIPQ